MRVRPGGGHEGRKLSGKAQAKLSRLELVNQNAGKLVKVVCVAHGQIRDTHPLELDNLGLVRLPHEALVEREICGV